MLLAEFLDDRRARRMPVAEDAVELAFGDQRRRQQFGKGGDRLGEIAPVEIDRRPGDLPMAGGRVLAARRLDAIAPLPRGFGQREAGRRAAGRGLHRMPEAERLEAGQAAGAAPQAEAVAEAQRTGLGDVAERIGALVAIGSGVLGAAAADRIENDEDRPAGRRAHWLTTPLCVGFVGEGGGEKGAGVFVLRRAKTSPSPPRSPPPCRAA